MAIRRDEEHALDLFLAIQLKISARSPGKPSQVSLLPGLTPAAKGKGEAITLKVTLDDVSRSLS